MKYVHGAHKFNSVSYESKSNGSIHYKYKCYMILWVLFNLDNDIKVDVRML